jgi:hypothetical protein
MTFGIHTISNVINHHHGKEQKPILYSTEGFTFWQQKAHDWFIGCHLGHLSELFTAIICWNFLFPLTFHEAATWQMGWVLKVVAFNLTCMWLFCGSWHWFTYMSDYSQGPLKAKKFNPENQYEKDGKSSVGFFSSSSGHLQREIFFTTLGWTQSAMFQCVMMNLWASGKLPYYDNFWATPGWSIGHLLFVTYWREVCSARLLCSAPFLFH